MAGERVMQTVPRKRAARRRAARTSTAAASSAPSAGAAKHRHDLALEIIGGEEKDAGSDEQRSALPWQVLQLTAGAAAEIAAKGSAAPAATAANSRRNSKADIAHAQLPPELHHLAGDIGDVWTHRGIRVALLQTHAIRGATAIVSLPNPVVFFFAGGFAPTVRDQRLVAYCNELDAAAMREPMPLRRRTILGRIHAARPLEVLRYFRNAGRAVLAQAASDGLAFGALSATKPAFIVAAGREIRHDEKPTDGSGARTACMPLEECVLEMAGVKLDRRGSPAYLAHALPRLALVANAALASLRALEAELPGVIAKLGAAVQMADGALALCHSDAQLQVLQDFVGAPAFVSDLLALLNSHAAEVAAVKATALDWAAFRAVALSLMAELMKSADDLGVEALLAEAWHRKGPLYTDGEYKAASPATRVAMRRHASLQAAVLADGADPTAPAKAMHGPWLKPGADLSLGGITIDATRFLDAADAMYVAYRAVTSGGALLPWRISECASLRFRHLAAICLRAPVPRAAETSVAMPQPQRMLCAKVAAKGTTGAAPSSKRAARTTLAASSAGARMHWHDIVLEDEAIPRAGEPRVATLERALYAKRAARTAASASSAGTHMHWHDIVLEDEAIPRAGEPRVAKLERSRYAKAATKHR